MLFTINSFDPRISRYYMEKVCEYVSNNCGKQLEIAGAPEIDMSESYKRAQSVAAYPELSYYASLIGIYFDRDFYTDHRIMADSYLVWEAKSYIISNLAALDKKIMRNFQLMARPYLVNCVRNRDKLKHFFVYPDIKSRKYILSQCEYPTYPHPKLFSRNDFRRFLENNCDYTIPSDTPIEEAIAVIGTKITNLLEFA